jgi:hypothetical protein
VWLTGSLSGLALVDEPAGTSYKKAVSLSSFVLIVLSFPPSSIPRASYIPFTSRQSLADGFILEPARSPTRTRMFRQDDSSQQASSPSGGFGFLLAYHQHR